MERSSLLWTPQAAFCMAAGLAMVALGAALSAMYLAIVGGLLLIHLAADAIQAGGRRPILSLAPVPGRVPEETEIGVRLVGKRLRAGHQVETPLSAGLRLKADSTNLWEPTTSEDALEFRVVAKVRGPQRIGPVMVRFWSPLRLWAHDLTMQEEVTVEVVPRVALVKRFGLLSRVVKPMQGRFQVNRPGHGFDFFTLRQYAPGDTMRSVNWKASARREDLIVNQRQLETHSEILILLDARTVMGMGPAGITPLDRGCRAALGLFTNAMAARDTIRFIVYGTHVTVLPAGTQNRIQAMESLLASLLAGGAIPARQAWETGRKDMRSQGPVIVITSGELDFDLPRLASDVLARGHPLTVVSPTPTDKDWEESPTRHSAREQVLQGLRQTGAVVVDWGASQQELAAERPVLGAVIR